MKAIVYTRFCAPDVLTLAQVSDPRPNEDEVLVRVHAAAVNSGDGRMRALDAPGPLKLIMRLMLGWSKPRRPVLGTVYAGVVEQVGAKVTDFQPGDHVYGSTGFQCACYAEKIAVKATSPIAQMPKGASFEEAAALPFGGQTTLHFLRKADTRSGSRAMVYGASGAVGTMAVQLLHLRGVDVTAVCSQANHALASSLGADRVLAYDTDTFANDPARYDLIFDCVGKLSEKDAKKRLADGGKYLTVGGMDVAKELKSDLHTLANGMKKEKSARSLIAHTHWSKLWKRTAIWIQTASAAI